MTTMYTMTTVALSIYQAAMDQGATTEMMSTYDMDTGDVDAVREYLALDGQPTELEDERAAIIEVERLVREMGRSAL